ncbi:MAG TPA: antitoxin [Nitrospinae bacterium]|nr:antitoxin [Nitrospinota bacterium]HBA26520.1 antitoxin [Nitrospinota bacterium]
MPKTIEAIYEDGVFKPFKKPNIIEHERVEITIKPKKTKKPADLSDSVHDLIKILHGHLPVSSIEEMARDSEIDAD